MALRIKWGKVDTLAKANSSPDIEDKQDFSDISLLKENLPAVPNIGTVGELNQTFLDESQLLFPSDPKNHIFGLWSKSISDKNGYFKNPPILDISFTETVTSSGLTLYFWEANEEFCSQVTIEWYDLEGVLLSAKTFYPNEWTYFCNNYIQNYARIKIYFDRTALPRRFVKFSNIDYGENIVLKEKNILEASLLESIGLTSEELYTNTVSCNLLSLDENFNIVTNPGTFLALQPLQQMEFLRDEGEEDTSWGNFFIGSVENPTGNDKSVRMNLIDLIGVLEKSEFIGGLYEKATFGDILNEIVTQSNLISIFNEKHNGFDVSDEILAIEISGYIPITNCREALHMLCYSSNVIANCMRGEKIKIFNKSEILQRTIESSNIIMNSYSIEDNQTYTEVTVNGFTFTKESTFSELLSAEYEVGTHKVTFSSPKADYMISGGAIISSGANFVEFTVETAGTVTISGKSYAESAQPYTAKNESYTGSVVSSKLMSDIKLVSPARAQSVAETQLWYYTQRYKAKINTIFDDSKLADRIQIKDLDANINSLEIDLVSEDISNLEVIGNVRTDL